MACPPCNLGVHGFCYDPNYDEDGCCCGGKPDDDGTVGIFQRALRFKPGENMRDVKSTGRHRAAVKIPREYITPGGPQQLICQWAGLLNAGGGIYPIVGCEGKPATDRHHGPNKSTLANDDDKDTYGYNLHAICSFCHNRWHVENDPTYIEPRPDHGVEWLPDPSFGDVKLHDGVTRASARMIELHNKWWAMPLETRKLLGGRFERSQHSEPPRELSGPENGSSAGENRIPRQGDRKQDSG